MQPRKIYTFTYAALTANMLLLHAIQKCIELSCLFNTLYILQFPLYIPIMSILYIYYDQLHQKCNLVHMHARSDYLRFGV